MKKRVKTSFKKVQKQEAINAVMIDGSKDYSYNHGGVYITLTPESSIKNFFAAYKAVKEDAQWWEDAFDFVCNSENHTNFGKGRNFAALTTDEHLEVHAKMNHDQWCDFARILLEQEGE